MGMRRKGVGWSGRYPGGGLFSHMPPWQRPGWLYRYGKGLGFGYVRGYGTYGPHACARFPWLPHWWWAGPSYVSYLPYPPALDQGAELERLEAEKEALEKDIAELKKHVEEGTIPRKLAHPISSPLSSLHTGTREAVPRAAKEGARSPHGGH